jgi:hypothetical protein
MRFSWIIVFCVASLSARADIRIERDQLGVLKVNINDTITERDAQALHEVKEPPRISRLSVTLDSRGGDAFSAMKIGRFIRQYDADTSVPASGKCYGSCTLVFIAGVTRANVGEVGLHRPYLASAPPNRQTVEKQVALALSTIKSYVAEMGITDSFYQQMVNTDVSQIRIYRGGEYKTLVPETDPTYAEIEVSYRARRFGITTSEMRQRDKDAEQCSLRERVGHCAESIRWGLSERVYRQRLFKSVTCLLNDEQMNILDLVPAKQVRDHPLIIENETCFRNVMLDR